MQNDDNSERWATLIARIKSGIAPADKLGVTVTDVSIGRVVSEDNILWVQVDYTYPSQEKDFCFFWNQELDSDWDDEFVAAAVETFEREVSITLEYMALHPTVYASTDPDELLRYILTESVKIFTVGTPSVNTSRNENWEKDGSYEWHADLLYEEPETFRLVGGGMGGYGRTVVKAYQDLYRHVKEMSE